MHSQPFFPLEKSFVALRDLSHRVFAVSRDVVINNHDVVRLSSSLVRPCSRTRIHEFKLKEEKKNPMFLFRVSLFERANTATVNEKFWRRALCRTTRPSRIRNVYLLVEQRGKKRNTLIIRFFCLSVFFYIHIYVYLKSEGRQIGRIKKKRKEGGGRRRAEERKKDIMWVVIGWMNEFNLIYPIHANQSSESQSPFISFFV